MDSQYIYGIHTVQEALVDEPIPTQLLIQENSSPKKIEKIVNQAKEQHVPIDIVDKKQLDQLTNQQNHQGVVAQIPAYQYASLQMIFDNAAKKNEDPFIVILDEIEDPHNLGSILRTSDAAGVHGVIIPKHRAAQLTSTVAKTSTGAIEYVPVVKATNLVQVVDELKQRGVWVYGTDVTGVSFEQWDAKGPVAVIIGNEGKGIRSGLKKEVDQMLTIPMVGHVQSLNASVAAALLIYQGFNARNSNIK